MTNKTASFEWMGQKYFYQERIENGGQRIFIVERYDGVLEREQMAKPEDKFGEWVVASITSFMKDGYV